MKITDIETVYDGLVGSRKFDKLLGNFIEESVTNDDFVKMLRILVNSELDEIERGRRQADLEQAKEQRFESEREGR